MVEKTEADECCILTLDCTMAGQSEPKDRNDTDKAGITGSGQMWMVIACNTVVLTAPLKLSNFLN